MLKFRRELFWWLGCLVVAEAVNLYAILLYQRPASELVSMIGYVFVISLVLYVACAAVRAVVALIRKSLKHK